VGDINEDTRRALRSLRWEESSIVSVDHELPEDEVDDAESICNAATVGMLERQVIYTRSQMHVDGPVETSWS
jgi:hypothetical protein